jgi:hypothetical protein
MLSARAPRNRDCTAARFTPQDRDGRLVYTFEGPGTVEPLINGVLPIAGGKPTRATSSSVVRPAATFRTPSSKSVGRRRRRTASWKRLLPPPRASHSRVSPSSGKSS